MPGALSIYIFKFTVFLTLTSPAPEPPKARSLW